jgi:hypothetical protein
VIAVLSEIGRSFAGRALSSDGIDARSTRREGRSARRCAELVSHEAENGVSCVSHSGAAMLQHGLERLGGAIRLSDGQARERLDTREGEHVFGLFSRGVALVFVGTGAGRRGTELRMRHALEQRDHVIDASVRWSLCTGEHAHGERGASEVQAFACVFVPLSTSDLQEHSEHWLEFGRQRPLCCQAIAQRVGHLAYDLAIASNIACDELNEFDVIILNGLGALFSRLRHGAHLIPRIEAVATQQSSPAREFLSFVRHSRNRAPTALRFRRSSLGLAA